MTALDRIRSICSQTRFESEPAHVRDAQANVLRAAMTVYHDEADIADALLRAAEGLNDAAAAMRRRAERLTERPPGPLIVAMSGLTAPEDG